MVLRGRLTPEIGAVLHRALEAAADQLGASPRTRRRRAWSPRCTWGSDGPTPWGGWPRWRSRPTSMRGTPGTAIRWCCTWRPRRPPTPRERCARRRCARGRRRGDPRFRGNVAPAGVRRERRRDAPRRGRARPRRRAQDADDSHRHSPRAERPRHAVPVSRLCRQALRRPPHRPLDGRWTDEPRQPGAAVPAASSPGPRRRFHAPVPARRTRSRSSTRAAAELRVAPPQPRVDIGHPLAPTTARLAAQGIVITPRTLPTWEGGPFNLGYAIDVLYSPRRSPHSRASSS